jgi:hypothetical protein
MGDSQSQKAGEGSTLIQAGGSVTIGLSYKDVKEVIAGERERIVNLIWARAQQMIRDLAQTPVAVPIKTAVRVIQEGSLEEDSFLQEQWASLLANATIGRVPPLFTAILSRLSRTDAVLLSAIFDEVNRLIQQRYRSVAHPTTVLHKIPLGDWRQLIALYAGAHLAAQPLEELIDERRHSLPQYAEDHRAFNLALDSLLKEGLLWRKQVSKPMGADASNAPTAGAFLPSRNHYRMTALGFEFVSACRPPKRSAADE